MYVCMYVCMYGRTYVCMHVCMYAWYVCMYACNYVTFKQMFCIYFGFLKFSTVKRVYQRLSVVMISEQRYYSEQ